jgi:hypothetical protein
MAGNGKREGCGETDKNKRRAGWRAAMFDRLSDTSEAKQALAKAKECAEKAAQAKTAKDRDYYDRMRRKWIGIADGWRLIDEIDKTSAL